VFKVVRCEGDGYISCTFRPGEDLCLDYALNEWTAARAGTLGVLVFTDLDQAKKFRLSQGHNKCAVLKCMYNGSIRKVQRVGGRNMIKRYDHGNGTPKSIDDVMAVFMGSDVYYGDVYIAPDGSHTVEAVLPVSIIV
jgi:hypothetical protein